MKLKPILPTLCTLFSITSSCLAADVGSAFYGDAPDEHHPWAIHDHNRPQPKLVVPGAFSTQEQPGQPPSDAIVLFDGNDLSKWEADEGEGVPTKWVVKNGAMECVPGSGYIRTKEKFGDCQLHVEWAAPTKVEGNSQGRGNSGVFLMGLVEVQVLDNYNNPTYADGFAASVYSVNPPLANALRPPGQFQSYDIVFRRPIYKNGKQLDPGYVTVFENGVLVQDHTMLEGETGHMRRSKPGPFPEAGPLKLQDHGNPVRYRNIWYRPLPPRAIEGGTDGYLTTEATEAKRKELAAMIRNDAEHLKNASNPVPQMLRLAESLVYEYDEETAQKAHDLANDYLASLKQLSPDQLNAKKDEVKHLRNVCKYLAKFGIIPDDADPKVQLEEIVKEHNWDKK
ncbi:MAG TPA: family 16 glycoside hydrolase [Candidatus Limnocylindrales bacterium]|nr:family 16 glycoside hydrolase [Candidatus Limnocylindrales bacterium]